MSVSNLLQMESQTSAWLRDVATGMRVPADIVDGMAREDFREIMGRWQAAKQQFREVLEEQGLEVPANDDWDWEDKAATTTPELHRFLGIQTDSIQGMMMLAMAPQPSQRPDRQDECVLYVEYLESAPWNLTEYAGSAVRYRRVGFSLLTAAIQISISLGCDGRLALHSLPEARSFYEKFGFINLGFDPEENFDRFELGGITINQGGSNGLA